ncbi:MAG: antibiotic biosynthesis monooxygenase [Gemmatimonadetes bacterium]|nr:antibiotic biosynthesis monooxygenase [Gemmatimonadota bacterium]
MIHVIAELTIAAGARDAFLSAFRRLEPLVRAEEGCLEYGGALEVPTALAAQTPPRPDVLLVIEKWTNEAALAAHLAAPHMAEFAAQTSGQMTGRVIRVARDVSGPHAVR